MARKEILFCDRCGKEFKPVFQVLQDAPIIFVEWLKGKKLYQLRSYDPKEGVYFHDIDLCYGCYKELVAWFEKRDYYKDTFELG